MTIEEIEQLIKDIPEELFEIPQYDKLIRTVSTVSTYGSPYVVLQITAGSRLPIAQFAIFDNMKFVFKLYLENRYRLISYLKTQIPNVLNQIKSYLSILGFKEVGLEGFIHGR